MIKISILEEFLERRHNICKDLFKSNSNVFKKQIKEEKIEELKLIGTDIFKFLEKPVWNFLDEDTLEKGKKVIEEMEESACRYLIAYKIHSMEFLKILSIPSFLDLLELDLKLCNITNIESISFINTPVLESIRLQQNRISVAKSCAKWCFPQLRFLNLEQNVIQESNHYSRIQFNTVTETYFEELNLVLERRNTAFINTAYFKSMTNIYNFNTKMKLEDQENIESYNLQLNSLFIEDPNFYAKLELHPYLIDHVQINQNEKILKFGPKSRKRSCPFKKEIEEKTEIYLNKENEKKELEDVKEFFYEKSPEKREKNKFIQENESDNEKVEENKSKSKNEYRYLTNDEKNVLVDLLIFVNRDQINCFWHEDEDIGFINQEDDNEDLQVKKRKQQFKRIQQESKIEVLHQKFQKP